MRYIHSLFVTIFVFFVVSLYSGVQEVFADSYLSQINYSSSSDDIKKLQNIFTELALYSEEIDGKFESIKDELIDFQIQSGIIDSADHDHAGYFGTKTIAALSDQYPEKFSELQDKYLKVEAPKAGDKIAFEATAYYSPVPGQNEYYMGSYEAEIRMQGTGITANGTEPHPGTLAASKIHAFGTKIYIEGIGVGEVQDRGGAIKGNKIDIWMGTGDAGRERALKFGRRTVYGYIVDDATPTNIEFQTGKVEKYAGLSVNGENPQTENVKKLQQLFHDLGLYRGEITGNYSDIKEILIDFQITHGVISSRDDESAGYFGRKSYLELKNQFGKDGLFVQKTLDDAAITQAVTVEVEEEAEEEDIQDDNEEDKKEEIETYNLSDDLQKLVEDVAEEIIKVYEKNTDSEQELDEAIEGVKDYINSDILPALREKKVESMFMYLVEIL